MQEFSSCIHQSAGQQHCMDAAGTCLPPPKILAPSEVPQVLLTQCLRIEKILSDLHTHTMFIGSPALGVT